MKTARIITIVAIIVALFLVVAPLSAFVFPKGTTFKSLYLKNTTGTVPKSTPTSIKTPIPTPTAVPVVSTPTVSSNGSTPFRDRYGSLLKPGSQQTPIIPSIKVLPTQIDPGWDSSGRLPKGWKYDPTIPMLYPPGWEEWDSDPGAPWLIDSGTPAGSENWNSVWS